MNGMNTMYSYTNEIKDLGSEPLIINIDRATKQNKNYRTALWTGTYLQVTLMSLAPGENIGLEIHPDTDQFIRVEDGMGVAKMGAEKDKLNYQVNVNGNTAVIVPAGTWHDIVNTGIRPLKLYTIYAPPHHPFGTVHKTKKNAEEAEH